MSDSPSKRARERRKAQKKREKKARRSELQDEVVDDHEALAEQYLTIPEDLEEGDEGEDADTKA